MEKHTAEYLFDDKIKIYQPDKGYRFAIDSIIIANHVKLSKGDKILDIGCGSGIISLILGYKYNDIKIFGVEIQENLSYIAEKNVQVNKMEDKISIINKDIKSLTFEDIKERINIIVTNPPYREKNKNRINQNKQKAVARHEIKINLEELMHCSAELLPSKGKIYIIYNAERISELLINMDKNNIQPRFIRFVHVRKTAKAFLVIIEGIKNGKMDISIKPPLYIYSQSEKWSKEVSTMFKY